MKGEITVLMCDMDGERNSITEKYLKKRGFRIINRECGNKIGSISPDICLFGVSGSGDGALNNIIALKSNYPDMKIIVLSYSSSPMMCSDLIDAGVDKYVLMPVSMDELLRLIFDVFGYSKCFEYEVFIAEFMSARGFKVNTSGFRYLCTAAALCICEPDCLDHVMDGIYKRLAEIHSVRVQVIERAMRHESLLAFQNGSDIKIAGSRIIGSHERPFSNTELICMVADSFSEHYKLFEN